MNTINLNCDVGEGLHNEIYLMPYINACNIACGGHFGDYESMTEVVKIANQNNVLVGAHPSYPDKINFGRKTVSIDEKDLFQSIQNQIDALLIVLNEQNVKLNHIKPHGALYNDIAKDNRLAIIFLKAIKKYENVKLFVPYNSEIEKEAIKWGKAIVYEAFADRNYNENLSLVSRNNENAVLTSSEEIKKHINLMINKSEVKTVTGKKAFIKAATFCVHSDTENAIEIVKSLRS
jgi:UPF0271 protein